MPLALRARTGLCPGYDDIPATMNAKAQPVTDSPLGGSIVEGVEAIRFRLHSDRRGNLVAFDRQQGLPFDLRRVFLVYDVPASAERAGHALSAEALYVAARGALTLALDNGREQAVVRLDNPEIGIHVHAGVFLTARNFTPDALFMVLSSRDFAEVTYAPGPFFFQNRRTGPKG